MDDGLERRVEALEGSQREIKSSLERHALATDSKLAGIDVRLAGIEAKLDALVKVVGDLVVDIRTLSNKARTDHCRLFGAIITFGLGLAALMAKGFHWV